MQIFNSIDEYLKTEYESSVALGFFDGVHKGHQKVISSCVLEKESLKSVVLTFKKSPVSYFKDDTIILQTNEDKIKKLEELKVDCVIFEDFQNLKSVLKEDFVNIYLKDKLKAKKVYCGENYHFGKGADGNTKSLQHLCNEIGIESHVVSPILYNDEFISSTRIKNAILLGKIEQANEMLGYNYCIKGKVEEGKHNGKTLGFPTINLPLCEFTITPKFGVYKTKVLIDDKEYVGATNIGVHPTISQVLPVCETFILNYQNPDDLYEKFVKVELLSFIREEKKFSNIVELINQVNKDIETIRKG